MCGADRSPVVIHARCGVKPPTGNCSTGFERNRFHGFVKNFSRQAYDFGGNSA